MNEREKLDQFEKWLRTVCFQPPTKEAYDLAKSAWNARAMLDVGWIPVSERLPEFPCLTYWDDDAIEAYDSNSVSNGLTIDDLMDYDSLPYKLTHWMPLPEPPTEE